MHINKVTLFGSISDAPELKTTKNDSQFCKLNLVTEKPVKKKNGDEVTIKNFHRVTLWGSHAKDASALSVGDPVYLEGEIQYGSYEKDGVKRYTTDINVGFDGLLVLFPTGGQESVSENPFS